MCCTRNQMNINISNLIRETNLTQEINLVFKESSFKDGAEIIEFSKPVELSGLLTSAGDIIHIDCKLKTELILTCSRCLEKFNYELCIEFSEEFSSSPDNKNDEVIFIDSDTIDITEIIQNNIIFTLPMKRLCKEDCKGLCLHCGSNLNLTTCNCDKGSIDPRLSKLKDLFSTD